MPEQKIINMNIANEAKALMADKFPVMVSYFLEDAEIYLQEIDRGLEEQNAEIAITPAHTMKSSAKQLGAEQISAIAKNIEELCRTMVSEEATDFSPLEQLVTELKEAIKMATPKLTDLCK